MSTYSIYIALAFSALYFFIFLVGMPKVFRLHGPRFIVGMALFSIIYGVGIGFLIDGLDKSYSVDSPGDQGLVNLFGGLVLLQLNRRGVFAKLPIIGGSYKSYYVQYIRWGVSIAEKRLERMLGNVESNPKEDL